MRVPSSALMATALLLLRLPSLGADQKGAESIKVPKSVTIVVATGSKTSDRTPGNVRVTYRDGSKDFWTTKGNASLARVAADGTVGWTVHGPDKMIAASYPLSPNGELILNRQGKVVARIQSSKLFIENWMFIEEGKKLVLVTRGPHGPASIELHELPSGKLIKSVNAYDENLPTWAKVYEEN